MPRLIPGPHPLTETQTMTTTEVISLLTGIGLAVISCAIYDAIRNARHLLPLKGQRRKAIEKKWSGFFTQPNAAGTEDRFSIFFTLKARGKRIAGSGEYTDGNQKVAITLRGGFYRDDHLHLSYINHDKAIFQHGLIILYWPNTPTILKGKFVGIGKETNAIVSGNIELSA